MSTKVCSRCREEKDRSEFRRHPSFADGLNSACKECLGKADKARYEKKKEQILAQQKEYIERKRAEDPEGYQAKRNLVAARHRANPDNTIKLRYLKTRYGLTVEEYQAMEQTQGGLCAICKGPPCGRYKRLHVDHDHTTGKVRGLLCFTCNTLLGHAKDQISRLENAALYLWNASLRQAR